jgi:hypothetical protein
MFDAPVALAWMEKRFGVTPFPSTYSTSVRVEVPIRSSRGLGFVLRIIHDVGRGSGIDEQLGIWRLRHDGDAAVRSGALQRERWKDGRLGWKGKALLQQRCLIIWMPATLDARCPMGGYRRESQNLCVVDEWESERMSRQGGFDAV